VRTHLRQHDVLRSEVADYLFGDRRCARLHTEQQPDRKCTAQTPTVQPHDPDRGAQAHSLAIERFGGDFGQSLLVDVQRLKARYAPMRSATAIFPSRINLTQSEIVAGAAVLLLAGSWALSMFALTFWTWMLLLFAAAIAGIWYVVSHLRYATGLERYTFWETLHFTSPRRRATLQWDLPEISAGRQRAHPIFAQLQKQNGSGWQPNSLSYAFLPNSTGQRLPPIVRHMDAGWKPIASSTKPPCC
jgi:hypothetical protein